MSSVDAAARIAAFCAAPGCDLVLNHGVDQALEVIESEAGRRLRTVTSSLTSRAVAAAMRTVIGERPQEGVEQAAAGP